MPFCDKTKSCHHIILCKIPSSLPTSMWVRFGQHRTGMALLLCKAPTVCAMCWYADHRWPNSAEGFQRRCNDDKDHCYRVLSHSYGLCFHHSSSRGPFASHCLCPCSLWVSCYYIANLNMHVPWSKCRQHSMQTFIMGSSASITEWPQLTPASIVCHWYALQLASCH